MADYGGELTVGWTNEEWVVLVEAKGHELCDAVKAAAEHEVPDALILPALIGVFREAGMLPDFDFSGLMGLLK